MRGMIDSFTWRLRLPFELRTSIFKALIRDRVLDELETCSHCKVVFVVFKCFDGRLEFLFYFYLRIGEQFSLKATGTETSYQAAGRCFLKHWLGRSKAVDEILM